MYQGEGRNDAIVIGGGPAGSCLAARLAVLGLDICLLQKPILRPRHRGESLSPGVMPLLDVVGARSAVESAGFPRAREFFVHWGKTSPELRQDPTSGGVLVERTVFDALLLNHARQCGVRVLQGAIVKTIQRCPSGWDLQIDNDGSRLSLRTKFVADAAGKNGVLPGRRRLMGRRTLALSASWSGTQLPAEPRIEAGQNAWYWGIPVRGRRYDTLVMIDAHDLRRRRHSSIEQIFHELLAASSLLVGCKQPRQESPIRAVDATASLAEDVVSPCSIKVGDAGLALDPLSSSGVQRAIQTALSGAIAVNTILRRPDSTEAAISFYRDNLERAAVKHHGWAASQYREAFARFNSQFWRDRAEGPETPVDPYPSPPMPTMHDHFMVSPEVNIVQAPCIDHEFVTRKAAVEHPAFDGPIAYLGGQDLAALLRDVPTSATLSEIVHLWSNRIPPTESLTLAKWLVARGVIIRVPNPFFPFQAPNRSTLSSD